MLAGGTAKPKGFKDLFEKSLKGTSLPIEISDEIQRRKLVASLIDWLLQCSAMQPDERQELMGPAMMPEARAGAVTPPEGHPKGKATSHSPVVAAAKSRVHPLVMERLDVSAASQLVLS